MIMRFGFPDIWRERVKQPCSRISGSSFPKSHFRLREMDVVSPSSIVRVDTIKKRWNIKHVASVEQRQNLSVQRESNP